MPQVLGQLGVLTLCTGQGHCLMCACGLVEGAGQLLGLLGQGHAGCVIARGVSRLTQSVAQAKGAQHHAARSAQATPGVSAQFKACAAQAAPVVICLVQQVAHLQPGLVLGGVGQLAGTVYAALGLGVLNKFLEGWTGAVLAKIMVLVIVVIFIQKRPQGLFAMKGRSAEA